MASHTEATSKVNLNCVIVKAIKTTHKGIYIT